MTEICTETSVLRRGGVTPRYKEGLGFHPTTPTCDHQAMSVNFDASAFGAEWNSVDPSDRRRVRRTVRMGRQVEPRELTPIATGYARWQMQRPWMRFFPLWFVPGIFVALGAAAQVHPILVGVTIALGAQAVWAYVSLRKIARAAP